MKPKNRGKPKIIRVWHWPFLRINSGGDKEYTCRHGVGHGGIHGCDGCCSDVDFPKKSEKRGAK